MVLKNKMIKNSPKKLAPKIQYIKDLWGVKVDDGGRSFDPNVGSRVTFYIRTQYTCQASTLIGR